MTEARANEQRVLVVAPFGRDAPLAVQTLSRAGFCAEAVGSVHGLIHEIGRGVGALIVAGEALDSRSMTDLTECISTQPPWSDIPIIVLTSDGLPHQLTPAVAPALGGMGNVTFLTRPFSVQTMVSIVRFALRSRQRQYRARELIDQLDETTKDLTRSNAEFQAFAYTAAHDMREPIRMIESYLSLVSDRFGEHLGATGLKYIGTAAAAASRMRTLLQALLAYAHVGNSGLVAKPISLQAVARAATKNLADAISHSSGEVTIASDELMVLGDEALLTQLLQNLIGNGLKFQKAGATPHIEVTWMAEGDQWRCSVRDNGIGIPEDARERVFAIFQRLHTMGEYPGSGIGLATCRRIVDRHGGRIWVESEVGVGSVFHVAIPTKVVIPAPHEAPEAATA